MSIENNIRVAAAQLQSGNCVAATANVRCGVRGCSFLLGWMSGGQAGHRVILMRLHREGSRYPVPLASPEVLAFDYCELSSSSPY